MDSRGDGVRVLRLAPCRAAVAPSPPRPAREIGLDVARALAVLGMFLAHFGAAAAGGGAAAAPAPPKAY